MPSTRWCIAVLMVGALLAGCGSSPSAGASQTASPLVTPSPSALPTVDAGQAKAACGWTWLPPGGAVRIGDLIVGAAFLSELSSPSVMLPDDTPLKPIEVDVAVSDNVWVTGSVSRFASSPHANPAIGDYDAGFQFAVCNTSTSLAHVLQGVSARIDTLAPYTGQLEVWKTCDAAYSRQHPGGGGGCGGKGYLDESVHATFPAGAGAGSTVNAVQISSGQLEGGPSKAGPLPYALTPGAGLAFNVGITTPTTPGIYTFAFGLQVDGTLAGFVPATPSLLFAPVVHQFTGAACATPAMEAQIPPATDPPTYYICPAS